MLGIIGLASIDVWSIELLAITGVAVVLLARCIDPEEAWRSIDGNVIVLIFGMLAFGVGLQQAGTVDLIVGMGIGSSTDLFGERSEEHTPELQSLMLISYASFCFQKK